MNLHMLIQSFLCHKSLAAPINRTQKGLVGHRCAASESTNDGVNRKEIQTNAVGVDDVCETLDYKPYRRTDSWAPLEWLSSCATVDACSGRKETQI